MRKIIDNLRKKPAHVRDQIAIFSALTFAGVVAFFWISSLATEYASPETKSSFNASLTPFKVLGSSARNAYDQSKADLETIDPSKNFTIDQTGVVNLVGTTETQ
ncbi:MAG: hypothetical protein RL641_677 [Candidatus Parcubacteria bacterium]|jgi:hypothetical protein